MSLSTALTIALTPAFHGNPALRIQFFHPLANTAMAGGLLRLLPFGPGRFNLTAAADLPRLSAFGKRAPEFAIPVSSGGNDGLY